MYRKITRMQLAVVTISDRCSQGQMTDTAGPAAAAILREQWPDAAIKTALLPDDEDSIAALLIELSKEAALIVTVGGTGFSPRDRTPEATRRVIDREAPGIAEAIRSLGAQVNRYAWLSRGVAGLRGTSLIVNLPGSERGAKQSLACILPLLKHGIEVAGGSQTHP